LAAIREIVVEATRNDAGSLLTDEARAASIHRRFKAARLDAMGKGFWRHWHSGDCSFLVGIYSALTILSLEPSLWWKSWPSDFLQFTVQNSVAISLLLVLPFNAWFFDGYLSSKTPGESALPRWLLGLRFLALSLPLFGLHTLSLWKFFLQRREFTSLRTTHRTTRLNLAQGLRNLPSGIRSRMLYRSGFFFAWIAMSFVSVLVWAVWLAGARSLGAWHRPLVLGVCLLLHLLSCGSIAQHLQFENRKSPVFGWRRIVLLGVPFLWLLAVPGIVVGFFIYLLASPSHRSLSWTGVTRDPLWQGLQGWLQRRWRGMPWFAQWRRPTGLFRSEGHSRSQAEIIALYRLKTLLLAFESAGIAALVLRVPSLSTAIRPAVWAALALGGMGLAIQMAGLLARLLRISRVDESLTRHPFGRYLLLTQTAFLAGTYGTLILIQGTIKEFGILLCLSAAFCGMMAVLFLLLPTSASPSGPDMTLWTFFYLAISASGGGVAIEGEDCRSGLLLFLKVSAALTPLVSLGLFLFLGGWLLRPFSWRHVLDPRLPRQFRAVLALVSLTAVLPLGGLAIPFWIYARHRFWPRYELFLQSSL
jgi:uncharacterized membrane protein YhdT